jgi:hypothetical protein
MLHGIIPLKNTKRSRHSRAREKLKTSDALLYLICFSRPRRFMQISISYTQWKLKRDAL